MEYWLIYDVASGELLVRGSGSAGMAAAQQLPDGTAMMLVPYAVVAQPEINLAALRDFLMIRVDNEAENVRLRYLTPGDGQSMTYLRKEAEARAWLADNTVSVPFLDREAALCDRPVADIAAEVVAQADAWIPIGSEIEALRRAAKVALASAITLPALITSTAIDWTPLVSPAA